MFNCQNAIKTRESNVNATFLKRWCLALVLAMLSVVPGMSFARQSASIQDLGTVSVASLPREVRQTLAQIRQGPPYPYAKDGVVFGNYEGLLPREPRGYYHEFTVKTPGSRNRGAQRVVVGGTPIATGEMFYTDDHYASFRRIRE